MVHLINFDIDQAGALARAKQAREAAASLDVGTGALHRLLRQSKLLLFAKRFVAPMMQGRAPRSAQHALNLAALSDIGRALPDRRIHFIHVPDKFEVMRGRYDLSLADEMKQRGIDYLPALERCKFSPELYYANDDHPNREGYRQLRECVARLLELNPTQLAP